MQDLECSGVWWLPTNPENRMAGTLTFSNEGGMRLNLTAWSKQIDEILAHQSRIYPLILGVTHEGELITLCNCRETSFQSSSAGIGVQRCLVETAYVGAHFSELTELRFHKFDVQYSHLADWVGVSPFRHQLIPGEQGKIDKVEVTYTAPIELTATTEKATVSIISEFGVGGDRQREVGLRHSVRMRIDLREGFPLEDAHSEFIHPLRNLLSLATDRPNSIVDVYGYSRGKTITVSNEDIGGLPIRIMSHQYYRAGKEGAQLFSEDMLFTFKEVADDFDGVIERWLKFAKELDSVCNLFYSVKYTPGMHQENQFLNVAHALESYHRRRIRNQDLSQQAHKDRLSAILDRTPQEHKSWLQKRLGPYSNEPSFSCRISELIKEMDEVMSPLVSDKKAFIRKAVDTRNFYTHYDPTLQNRAAHRADLYWLTQQLSFLMEGCFLKELGFSPEKRREIVQNNRRYWFVMDRTK